MAIASLNQTQPNLGWSTLLVNLDAKTDSIDMGQPAYYGKLNELLGSVSIHDWKSLFESRHPENLC
jgi:putative endopeptidase